jgi:GT2 family glycosyltransferase
VSAWADVTVTISTLDRPETLARCLDALLSGRRLPGEVVIVDQGENPATRAVVEGGRSGSVPIRYVRQERRGLSSSRNAALHEASRSVIAVTDDDCVPSPGWIAALENAFAVAEAPEAVTGRVLPLGPDAPGRYAIASRESPAPAMYRGRALPWHVGSGNNFAVRRDWYARLDGCDERLGVGSPGHAAEDMDLFYRLLRQGARIRYDPEVLVYHERDGEARRLATRWSYGHGVGAFCGMTLRRGDSYAAYILARWLLDRGRDLGRALVGGDEGSVRQQSLSLGGTLRGLVYGLRV